MAADYNAGVYRKQGGNELVVASTTSGANQGKITLEAGSLGVAYPTQALTSTETGTNMTVLGLTTLEATTTGPTYTLPAPPGAGVIKGIAVSAATSAASNVVVAGETTGIQIGPTGDNQITITSTGACAGVLLWSVSTSNWAVVGGGTQVSAAQST